MSGSGRFGILGKTGEYGATPFGLANVVASLMDILWRERADGENHGIHFGVNLI